MRNERGLTLLELLMVVTILSAVAWMSLGLVSNNADQVRFEDTRNRLQAIRRAIVGDTSRTLNGQPELRGYVADMGNLPADLNELIAQGTQPDYGYDPTYGLWAGWNGPYLAAAELLGSPRFQDGWGRNDGSSNFGWRYVTDPSGDLTIQSYGRDGEPGGTGDYEADYPPGQPYIAANAYRLSITDEGPTTAPGDGRGGLWVAFGTPPPCWLCSDATSSNRKDCVAAGHTWGPVHTAAAPATCTGGAVWLPNTSATESICLAVARRAAGSVTELVSLPEAFVWDGSQQLLQFRFADGTTIHQGQMSFRIFEHDGANCTDKAFPAGMTQWKLFSVVPGSVLQPLAWDVE